MVKAHTFIKFILIGILSISIQLSLHAQQSDFETYVRTAKDASERGDYKKAVKFYKQAYQIDSSSLLLTEVYVSALKYTQHYQNAVPLYKKLIAADTANLKIEQYLLLAECLKHLERYKEAMEAYENFRVLVFEKDIAKYKSQIDLCNREIEACSFALRHSNGIKATVTALPSPINTVYSEFNPIPLSGGKLYYSSYYPVFQDSFNSLFSDLFISEIFLSRLGSNGWQIEGKESKRINNRKDHNANITLSRDGSYMYFSRCKDIDGRPGECQIYRAEKSGDNWTSVKALPSIVNKSGTSNTHPYLVQTRAYDIIYFTSNRKGGFGGQDIWYVIVENGKYSEVQNLGSNINTPGNEITPTYDRDNEILYFSSDYHSGFGGFDVFKSTGGLNGWTAPKNLGHPVNSSLNDLYYITYGFNEAYLASNRKGSMHSPEAEFCCNDIYHVIYEEEMIDIPVDTPVVTVDTTIFTVEKQIQDLLPISLYFHNDIPDPKTTKTTTDKNYEDLLANYILLKSEYSKAYSEGLEGQQAIKASADIESFFADYVENGFSELNKLTGLLLKELEEGKHVRIVVRGYASPLNNSDYNYKLSKRRIASLVNYLKSYQDGIFKDYLEGNATNGGQLSIFEDPQGDSQAAEVVSDNPNDKRNSVYSRSAALERRIQIVRYQSSEESEESKDYPILKITKDTIYIDSIDLNKNHTFIIPLENIGNTELQILKIEKDCDCIEYQLKNKSIQSGKNESMYLLLKGNQVGDLKKITLSVFSNELNKKQKITILIIN